MKGLIIPFLMTVSLFCVGRTTAQQTSIDLRTDGRILTGTRKDYLLQCIKAHRDAITTKRAPSKSAVEVRDDLANMLNSSIVTAIVVPPGKTADQYLIGLLIGDDTLPKDYVVSESDFNKIREISRNQRSTAVEAGFRGIQRAISMGDYRDAAAKVKDLRATIAGLDDQSERISVYAGYLLADLDQVSHIGAFGDLVGKYRTDVEHTLDPILTLGIKQSKIPWATPYKFSGVDDFFKVRDLEGSAVSHVVGTNDNPGYLKVWHGRTLVVIAEKPDSPFSSDEYKSGWMEYMTRQNPNINRDAAVKMATMKP
ncbi:MAG: hypothetical protein WAL47_16705 [Pyrinomonadaceae bacterium]